MNSYLLTLASKISRVKPRDLFTIHVLDCVVLCVLVCLRSVLRVSMSYYAFGRFQRQHYLTKFDRNKHFSDFLLKHFTPVP